VGTPVYCVIVVVPDIKLGEILLHRTVRIKIAATDKYELEFCSRKLHVSAIGAV
jgi:hypothetical protein